MDDDSASIGGISRKLQSVQEKEKTFSLTSEIKPNATKWNSGTRFTCKSTHNSIDYIKTISICDVHANVPPSIRVEIPSLETVVNATSQVQATCLVRTVFGANVTWVTDGHIVPEGKVDFSRNASDLRSILTLPSSQWKQLKLLTCKAEHICFSPSEKTINLAEPSATAPLVEIRRYLPDLQKGNSSVLECDVTQLSSSDILITSQANGLDISDSQLVKLPKAPGLHSISRRFTVPSSHWKKDTHFTCNVNQGFSRTFKSKSTGTFIVDPSVDLLLVPRKETEDQKLLCIGRGLDPQILWLSESQKRHLSSDDISMDVQGHVTVISELQIPQTEWETGKVFTCQVDDRSLNKSAEKHISVCSVFSTVPPSIHVEIPSLETVMKATAQVQATCLVRTVFGANVTWVTDGHIVPEGKVDFSRNASDLRSILTLPSSQWKQLKLLTCKAEHRCFSSSEKTINLAEPSATAPLVEIRRYLPDLQKGNRTFKSKSTGKFIVDPSVDLLLVPRKETEDQKLLCIGRGLDPQILWLSESQKRHLSSDDISMDVQGHVTVISELQIPQTEWETGKVFTCQVDDRSLNKSAEKHISVCSVFSTVPPSIHVEIPSLETVMKATAQVQATCLVRTVFGANVTWVTDGHIVPESQVDFSRNASDLRSILTLPSSQWKQLKLLTCKAEHSCFSPSEKTINLAEPSATAPLVEIRRYLPDLQKGNSSVLECDVTQLSSSDILITFQANGLDISDSQLVKLPKAPGLHSISRRFTVPSSHWKKDTHFTCNVNQGFSRTFKSKSTGTFIVDPSVDLLLVPRKETEDQKLLCIGRGLDPQILWLSESQKRHLSSDDISMDVQGHVTVISELQIPQTEWETGKVFTCQVDDRSLNKSAEKHISVCSVFSTVPPSIHVEIPSLETVMKATAQVQATCLVRTVFGANVTWVTDGHIVPESQVDFSRNASDLRSILTLPSSQWKQLKLLTCKAEHRCFSSSEKTINLAEPSATAPLVEIRRYLPDLQKGNSSVLECDVTQLSSSDILITFQANGLDISDSQLVKLPKAPGLHSISRRFTVPSSHWKKNTNFTCNVNQVFSRTFKSRSTVKFIVDPSVDLLLVPRKETEDQKLLCIGRGFDPQILWLSESQKRPLSSDDISMDAQGHVTVISELLISQKECETGKVFTCQVDDRSLSESVRKNISICSEIMESCNFFDELSFDDVDPDMEMGSWHMAFAFLLFFLIAIIYSVIATIIKTKK
ncbi:uncharacterized protein LOC142886786 isoform X3 [Nelusetta ayraudi]